MQKKIKILIIEDDKDIAKGIATWLEIKGYEATVAHDGNQGVQQARKTKPDLILMDIQMPFLNGKEACRILKNDRETYNIPIIMVTSQSDTSDLTESYKLGANDYIIKPFAMERLEAKIKEFLS